MTRLLLVAALFAVPAAAQAPCAGGRATLGGVAYPCEGIDLVAVLPAGFDGPLRDVETSDVWGWTDAETGREIALVGVPTGTVFVDVTEPAAPRVLGKLLTQTDPSHWRDVKVYRDHAVVVAEAPGHGMQVFSLARLRGLGADPDRTFAADAVYAGFGNAHNVALNEATGYAYGVGSDTCAGGLHMVDVRTPTAPAFAGCVAGDGYTHDAQCVLYNGPDADYAGREVCFAYNVDRVTVTDVTDKQAPVRIGSGFYPNPSYTHQGWLTEDGRYALVDDELDDVSAGTQTVVMDVADLDDLSYAFSYRSRETAAAHNQFVRGRYSFQSNYAAGLRVLDLTGIAGGTLAEVASFDTAVGPGARQWGNYPYFASGIVVVTDVVNGVFVLRPTGLVTAAEAPGAPAGRFALGPPVPNPTTGETRLRLVSASP